jgi:hypothetical protein
MYRPRHASYETWCCSKLTSTTVAAMPQIHTSVIINASPSRVRRVFLDFPSFPLWNPFLSVETPVASPPAGTKLTINANGHVFKPRVIENSAERFSWVGLLFSRWIFEGHHFFEFEPFGGEGLDGETASCKFVHREKFRGLFSWLILFLIRKDTEKGFIAMNVALKKQAETIAID